MKCHLRPRYQQGRARKRIRTIVFEFEMRGLLVSAAAKITESHPAKLFHRRSDKTTFPAARNSFWTFPTFGDLDGMRNFVVRQRAASDCNFDQQFQFKANIYWFALNYTVPHFSVPESFDTLLHNIEFHFSRLLQQGFPRFETTFIQLVYL